ncbi:MULTISPECIES: DUF6095 family protein [Aestuariibaculum]|uniref:DUF6095 family protein n=1 Tax=Aestuariibaculum lutulentum TaxID=2920935 RepID=A0ABS9RJA9_9FLAO|nr:MULTISPECIES: DUF6095 family protein [Aestuariibaculum]MCH4553036.1 DUF6095 family protein [Aestuariibaculum lutulentum]MCR8669070.1 DUF6095 family protein [Aestuariibaculum sp. M13]
MEETNRTDKKVLFRGIKLLVFALLSLFMGPVLLTFALSDKENSLYLPLLIIASLICAMAVFLVFKGIKIIMSSMFKK